MAHHGMHSEIQAFHAFLQENVSYAVIDHSSTSARREFQSIKAIREYFEQNGSTRLGDLLLGVWYPDKPLVDPNDILQNYIAVFCILVELRRGTLVEHFCSRDLSDMKLPFDPSQSPPMHFPIVSDNPHFFRAFCDTQWKYCAPEFRYPMTNIHFEDQRILPIVSKELIAGGGSALLYRIRLHPWYNRLDPRKASSSEPQANTYALKTYTAPDASVYYKNEVTAFRRLKQSQGSSLIGFYGSFIQGHTFNIIFDYADQGTLEHYFSENSPPSKGVDIINFWESLFKAIWGLKCIHEVGGKGASDGPQILHGFHQDIKPANLLVCSNGESSRYTWQLKLADLGLSHFNKITEGLGIALANDRQGTRTYGAPECYRGDDYTNRWNIKFEQRVDIWSLGCIFSEAAIWIAYGYNGIEEYRHSRRLATNHIDGFRESDCFHDGQDVLPVVNEWHFEAHTVLRQADFITKAVLSLVEHDMLVVPVYRASAQQLWGKSVTILQRAKDQLNQMNLAHTSDIFSSGDVSIRSPRQTSPESPPSASGSRFRSSAVVVHATRAAHVGNSGTPQEAPDLPPPGLPPSRHQSVMQAARSHQQRSSTHGESSSQYSQIAPGGRQDYSPDRLPSRKSTRTTQRSTSADFDGDSWQGSKVSFYNPENHHNGPQQSPHLVESPEQEEHSLRLQQQRPATIPSRSIQGSQQGSKYVQEDDDDNEMHRRESASGSLYPHTSLPFPPRKETQSSTATTTTEEDSLTPAPTPKAQRPSTKSKRTAPPRKSTKTKGKEPKQEKAYLSVAKAGVWKAQSQAQTSLGFGSSKIRLGPKPEPLPHAYLLERLERRDHAFLVDNTSSMKPYWEEVINLVGILAYMVKPYDSNGLELMCTNSSLKSITSKTSSKLVAYLEKTKPAGMSDISIRLNSILEQYKAKIHEVYGAGFRVTARARNDVRPLTLYVLTDGVWQPKCDAEAPIKNLVQKLLELKSEVPRNQVGIQFIYFGNNAMGNARVKKLDDSDTQLDIVDAEPSTGNVWKMLFGAIDTYSGHSDNDTDDDDVNDKVEGNCTSSNIVTTGLNSIADETSSGQEIKVAESVNADLREFARDGVSFQLTASHSSFNPETPHVSGLETSAPIFVDSGYDGSSINQGPLPLNSTDEFVSSAKQAYSDNDPQEVTVSTTVGAGDHDGDFDVRSIVSNDTDIQSKVPSTFEYWERVAEENIGILLATNTELRVLAKEAIGRVGKDRFTVNLRRLLKAYYLDLRQLAVTRLEVSTVKLLQNRYSRTRLSQQIADIMDPETEQNEEQQPERVVKERKELEDWITQNPSLMPPPLEEDVAEAGFSSDDSASESESSEAGDQQPNIAQMESFLLTCGDRAPFLQLSTNLRLFLLPPMLSHLARILMSLPEKNVWLDAEENTSMSNRFKSFVEDVTEENWNWWPLQPRMHAIKKGHMRLHWLCHCQTHLWTELPRSSAEKLQALVRGKPLNTKSSHLCARRSQSTLSVYDRITLAAGFAPNASGTSSHHPPFNSATSTTDIRLNQFSSSGPKRSTASPPSQGSSVSSGQEFQVNINSGPAGDLLVLLGIKGSRRTLELAQIDVSKHKEDKIFFRDLLHEYRQRRGLWRCWLSVWKLRHCDFVRFEKIRANRIISNEKHDLPVDQLYEYSPKPPDADIPPIDPHEFELSLAPCNPFCIFKPFHDCIEPPDGGLALERIPKRKAALELKVGTREQAWGLLTQYSISALLLLFYLVLCFVPFVGFWVWWQIKHPDDLQNASTPLMVFATLLCVWFASLVYLKGQ